MKKLRIYRHPDCPKCARYARWHERLDWCDRIEISTAVPPSGPLSLGEVVVEDIPGGRILHGAEAAESIAREIPAYMPFRLLLKIPAVRRAAEKEMNGCGGAGCELPLRP